MTLEIARDARAHSRVDLRRRLRARRRRRLRTACSPATRSSSATSGGPTCSPRPESELTADVLGAPAVPLAARQAAAAPPDATRVYPAHGAGSSCGRHLSTETSSTLGEQRRFELRAADRWTRTLRRRWSPKANRRVRTTSSSTRSCNRAASPVARRAKRRRCSTIDEVITLARRRRDPARSPRARRLRGRAPARARSNVGLGGRFAEWAGVGARARRATSCSSAIPRRRSRRRSDSARVGYDRVVGQLDDLGRALRDRPGPRSRRAHGSRSSSSPSSAGSSRTPARRCARRRSRRRTARCRERARSRCRCSTDFARRSRSDESRRRLLRERLPLIDRRERLFGPRASRMCPTC